MNILIEAEQHKDTKTPLTYKEYKAQKQALQKQAREQSKAIEQELNALQKPQIKETLKNIQNEIKEYDKALNKDSINEIEREIAQKQTLMDRLQGRENMVWLGAEITAEEIKELEKKLKKLQENYKNYQYLVTTTYKGKTKRTKEQIINLSNIDTLRQSLKNLEEEQIQGTDGYKNIIKKHLDNLDTQFNHYQQQKQNNYNEQINDLMQRYQDNLLRNLPKEYQNNDKLKQALGGLRLDTDKYGFIELKAFERGHLNKDDYFYTQDEQLQRFHKYRTRDRGIIENELNISPNKEYGVNYAEFYHDGQGAINKLISEAKDYEARKASDKLTQAEKEQGQFKGQVAEAFYKKDLEDLSGTGRIDLVWGDDSFGLKHILEQRTAQWGEEKALQFINDDLARIVNTAQVCKNEKGKIELITESEMVVLGKGYDNRFVITAFKDRRSKERIKSVEKQQILDDVDFTSKSVSEQLKVDDILLQNHDNIIPQKNNQSQALDMNDDSALKALKNEVSNTKESEIENNTSSQDYQTELLKHKRQRR